MKKGDRVTLSVRKAGFRPGAGGRVVAVFSDGKLAVNIDRDHTDKAVRPPFPLPPSPASHFSTGAAVAAVAASLAPPAASRKARKPPKGRRCTAKVGRRRCKNWTVEGTDRCYAHRLG